MWKQLIQAIKNYNTDKAKKLIQELDGKVYSQFYGIKELDRTDVDDWTALHWAAWKGMKEVCELLISKMSPKVINAVDSNGNTALFWAVAAGKNEVCKLLISKMSLEAINAVSSHGDTALMWAAYKGMKEVCELLIPKMIPEAINIAGRDSRTALHLAAEGGYEEVCKVLICNMDTTSSVELLKQSSNDSLIQKVTGEIAADFINDKFSGSGINTMDFTGYQVKLLKLYQVVDRSLLNSYLIEEKGNNLCINSADNYITKHYFTLIGVCKSVNEDSPISILASSDDCMSCMLLYLAPHSLCPELFDPIELSGESKKANSENEEGWCSLA